MIVGLALASTLLLSAAPPPVARVVMFKGPVSVVGGDQSVSELKSAKDLKDLLETDTVKVGPQGLAVLKLLKNGYLVRVDDEIDLLVADIALLHAPATTLQPAAQLDQLLSSQERPTNTRMAGWVSELHGGSTKMPGSETEEARERKDIKRKEASNTVGDDEIAQTTEKTSPVVPRPKSHAQPPPPAPSLSPPVQQPAEPPVAQALPMRPGSRSDSVPSSPGAGSVNPVARKVASGGGGASVAKLADPDASLKACLASKLRPLAQTRGLTFSGRSVKVSIRSRGGAWVVVVPAFGFPIPELEQCLAAPITARELGVSLE